MNNLPILRKEIISCIIFLFAFQFSHAQQKKNVLFIGNSYTSYNNLPQLTSSLAISAGDTLVYDSNTPGGQTFQGHLNNNQSISKIQLGTWDFVVLQEQSQLPSFPIGQVENQVFPFAEKLDSIIHKYNNCATTLFYMTWGRKNGDAPNCPILPALCTYEGMDNLLRERYMMMAQMNNAAVSPVGAVWRYLREHHPEIELYQTDESHPTLAGSYAAACSFYTVIFRKSPLLITQNSGLNPAVANSIRTAAKMIVFDSLSEWKTDVYDPVSSFSFHTDENNAIAFSNESIFSDRFLWNFGDGFTSVEENPVHTYAENGNYTVSLIAERCDYSDTFSMEITISNLFINQPEGLSKIHVFPNPTTSDYLIIETDQPIEIELFNSLGSAVDFQLVRNNNRYILDVQGRGNYILKVIYQDNVEVFKINKL